MIRARIFILGLLITGVAAASDEGSDPIPSNWKCKYCPYEVGVTGEIEVGAGYVSEDDFKFDEYRGFDGDGLYAVGNGEIRYQGEDGEYWNITADNLGLRSRSISFEGGKQGRYDVSIDYDQIQHRQRDNALTPYLGVGHDFLPLPASWVPANVTSGMTSLPQTLQSIKLETDRKRVTLGANYLPSEKWKFSTQYRHETKQGKRASGAAIGGPLFFLSRAAILPEPIEHETQSVDLSLAYLGKKGQMELGYNGSFFNEDNKNLTWQNAFSGTGAGTEFGSLGLSPDNQAHQLRLVAGYQLMEKTRASGQLTLGRMLQDENFLPYTVNPGLQRLTPKKSADAQVDTVAAQLRVTSNPMPKLRLNGSVAYSDRDNSTNRATYDYVVADAANALTSRTNMPYSFTRWNGKVNGRYRLAKHARMSLGVDYDKHERSHQQINDTREHRIWGELNVQPHDRVDVELKYSHADRDASSYKPVAEVQPPQNALLRKYNMADRRRDQLYAEVSWAPHELVNISLSGELADDDYTDSTLGLTEGREHSYTINAFATPMEDISLNGFFSHERIKSRQAGSQAFSTQDWGAKNKDRFYTVGAGIKRTLMEDRLSLGMDYVFSRSVGEIDVDSSAAATLPFPDLKTRRHSVQLYGDYQTSDEMSFRLEYLYERYREDDWPIDGVAVDTIPTVLSLGEESFSYTAHVITTSVQYRF